MMKQLELFLSEKREVTIHTVASYIRQYIREQAPVVLQENHDRLLSTFDKAGEYTYGLFARTLFEPLQEQLQRAGLIAEPSYPGHFVNSSIEYWGPPEERERCLWCVIRTAQGEMLGTIVTRWFHDHTQFRVPHAPGIVVLEETEAPAIIEALSHASVRLSGTPQEESSEQEVVARPGETTWEYSTELGLADYIDAARIEITGSMLEHALTQWGRYGWELVNVIPHEGRLLAFFKRPKIDNA